LVHDYYFYANAVFLVLFLGLGVLSLLDLPGRVGPVAGVALCAIILAGMYWGYAKGYGAVQVRDGRDSLLLAQAVKVSTDPHDVILVLGWGWDPWLPYHAERRALTGFTGAPPSSSRMRQALDMLRDEHVTAMVVRRGLKEVGFVQQMIRRYGFMPKPVFSSPIGEVYALTPASAPAASSEPVGSTSGGSGRATSK
jgi:hypothetical protein